MHELRLIWPRADGARTWNGIPLDDPAVTNGPITLAVIDTAAEVGAPPEVTPSGDLLVDVAGVQYNVFIAIIAGGTDLALVGVPTSLT